MECPKCKSNNTNEKSEEGDTYFECQDCKYTVENGIETNKGGKK